MGLLDEGNFEPVGKEVEPDERKRLALAAALPKGIDGIRYRVFRNSSGQILLDPVKSVPIYEAWIYENPKRIESILRGVAEAESGKVVKIKLPRQNED
jgi:hypothetical protein